MPFLIFENSFQKLYKLYNLNVNLSLFNSKT